MYHLIPRVRNGGYIPFFVTERKRSEAAPDPGGARGFYTFTKYVFIALLNS